MIISNKVKCGKCGDVVESRTRHEMVWCSCGNVAADGGKDYLRRAYMSDDWTDVSEEDTDDVDKA